MKFLLCLVSVFANIISIFGQQSSPIVTFSDGQVQGVVRQTIDENNLYYAFLGIPFAEPPLGDLRFAVPVKNEPWDGVLDASEEKSICIQTGSVVSSLNLTVIGSEDCLYINVYAPSLNESLPVMVWIYGGGFVFGSSLYAENGPDYILDQDVIFVAFNYRLGVFGFLSTEDLTCPGNWGLKDQVLALEWVKENIAAFGGDPNRITIFGESAGSASVSYMVQSSRTAGLFSGAIMESGTSLSLWALSLNARHKAFSVGAHLNIITFDASTLISSLREVDAETLKLAENHITLGSILIDSVFAGLPFGVVQEPQNYYAVVTKKSHQSLSNGDFQRVSSIIGFNSNEGGAITNYVGYLAPILFQYDINLPRLAPYDLTSNFFKRLPAGIAIKNHYFGLGTLESQPLALVKFFGVDQFNRPTRETVRQMSKYSNVYFYQFSYKGVLGDAPNNNYEGVGHADELNYLFVRGKTGTADDYQIRTKFVRLWTNFAKFGNPTPANLPSNDLLAGVSWTPNAPGLTTDGSLNFLNINSSLTLGSNPDQTEWQFYQTIYNTYGDPPYTTY